MRRFMLTLALAGFGFLMSADTASAQVQKASAKKVGEPVSFTAQVVDLSCKFVQNASGSDHKMCAQVCADKGQPLGFLTGDGEVLLPVNNGMGAAGENDRLKPFAEEQVRVTGRLIDRAGLKAVIIESITKV